MKPTKRTDVTPSENGCETPEVVGYTTAGMLRIAKELPLTGRIGAKCKQDGRWNVPLMTVAQHSRIVAAKDAEIARLNRNAIPVELLERCLEQMESDWLQIDGEWGPTKGGLEGAVANGDAEEIRELRALLAQQKEEGLP